MNIFRFRNCVLRDWSEEGIGQCFGQINCKRSDVRRDPNCRGLCFPKGPDQAFEWLDRAHVQHDTGVAEIKWNPPLKNLCGDPAQFPGFLVIRS